MTTTLPTPTAGSKRVHHSLKIDMTPMVDLGFLLITFFVFTASLSEPTVTRLIMPKEGAPSPIKASNALTLLLDGDKAFVYEGTWDDAKAKHAIKQTDYSLSTGVGNYIRQKQNRLAEKDDLFVSIKPLSTSSYQNLINALDEMQINNVQRYAIVAPAPDELQTLAGQ